MTNPVSVWTGDEVLVCCGNTGRGRTESASYDPDMDQWVEGPTPPLASSNSAATVWTGGEMLVLTGDPVAKLAAFDPGEQRWVELANPPFLSSSGFEAVWTGDQLLAWPRFNRTSQPPSLYDRASDTWTTLELPPELADMDTPSLIWTGSDVIAWGVGLRADTTQIGGMWRPGGSWTAMPPAPLPPVDWTEGTPGSQMVFWTGEEAVVWVGELDDTREPGTIRILAFDPGSGVWTDLPPFTWTGVGFPVSVVSTSQRLTVLTTSGDFMLEYRPTP